MINIIIAYDDNDSSLGTYFQESFANVNRTISTLDFVYSVSIRGLECTEQNINLIVSKYNDNPYIFVALSHGDEYGICLLTENETFISQDNSFHFKNSLFYTTACNAGIHLCYELIGNNCKCFIGYKHVSYATYDEFEKVYIECETYALTEFIKTKKTIGQCFNDMMDFFDEQIRYYEQQDEILLAMDLIHNRRHMMIEGNENLLADNFHL